MSLILVFHNDGTGKQTDANYNVRVMVGDGTLQGTRDIDGGRVVGHNRGDGWDMLVAQFLRERKRKS